MSVLVLAAPERLEVPGDPGMDELARLAAHMRAAGYNAVTCAIAERYLSRFG